MLVEMRLEDTVAPPAATRTPPKSQSELQREVQCDAQPETAALRELIAAGLVSHEAIGDPGRLAGEAATLRAICGLVAGPVYRLEPFHYAFAVRPEDLGGALAGLAAEARTTALQAALTAALGAEAVWLGAADLAPEETEAAGPVDAAFPAAPVLLLRAQAAAVAEGLAAAGPGVQAVIDATYAVACARLTAGAEAAAPVEPRIAALEAAIGEMQAAMAAQAEATGLMARLGQALNTVLKRLDVQSGALHAHIARENAIAGRLTQIAAAAAAPAAFQETLGLTLAEFLAGLERRAETGAAAPHRAPQAG